MILYGNKVKLRAMEYEDLDLCRQLINDPDIENYVVGWSFPISESSQRKWYESSLDDSSTIRLMVETIEDSETIGVFILSDIDWKNRSLSTAMKLKTEAKGKGYATDARFAVLKYLFEELNFHKVNGAVLDCNIKSQQFTEKCGSKKEGVRRQEVFKNGCYHDLILYGTLYEDYKEAVESNGWKPK